MLKIILLSLSLASLSGCTIIQTIEPAEITKGSQLCIIKNPAVRQGFLQEFKSVLTSKGINYKITGEDSSQNSCEWTATYVARWTWDLALYMSYAEIKVYHNGILDGEAKYDSTSGGANMSKFIDAEPKIRELVNQLMQYKTSSLFSLMYG